MIFILYEFFGNYVNDFLDNYFIGFLCEKNNETENSNEENPILNEAEDLESFVIKVEERENKEEKKEENNLTSIVIQVEYV